MSLSHSSGSNIEQARGKKFVDEHTQVTDLN